ncbi:hypothetical protein FEE59_13185 [Herbaspirillum sp. RU 5E]|nr:hypothetical protein [Herbaspirillum sp. RU 5E]
MLRSALDGGLLAGFWRAFGGLFRFYCREIHLLNQKLIATFLRVLACNWRFDDHLSAAGLVRHPHPTNEKNRPAS